MPVMQSQMQKTRKGIKTTMPGRVNATKSPLERRRSKIYKSKNLARPKKKRKVNE
jgi:hypothetical protein